MIVMKFGGTSLESAAAIERVARIVAARLERRPVVVVSALGKTTDHLLALARETPEGIRRKRAFQLLPELRSYHLREAKPVIAESDWAAAEATIDGHFRDLSELLHGMAEPGPTLRLVDAISSFGERLSSSIVSYALRHVGLNAVHVDARSVIITDARHTQASPVYASTYARLSRKVQPLVPDSVVVMGGFIGSTEHGVTTTLGRGGSDFTAALVGAGIGAAEIQIWTDVDGMLTCDPAILPGGYLVKSLSFAEAAELACFGARILHSWTVLPAVKKSIPVLILNSRRPEAPGTRIVTEAAPCSNLVKSIACARNLVAMHVWSPRMPMAHGFLRWVLGVFNRHETPVEVVSASEAEALLVVAEKSRLAGISEELGQFFELSFRENQALVSLVGDNIRHASDVADRVLRVVKNAHAISQGPSRLNVRLLVSEDDLAKTVESLHREFFAYVDPTVFGAATPVTQERDERD